MKKRMTRLLSTLCALALLATLLSVTVFADDTETYTFDNVTGTLTISGTGGVDGIRVGTAVGEGTLKAVIVEDGVTFIEEYSFQNQIALESLSIFGALNILDESFRGCSNLTSAYFFDNVNFGNRDDIFTNCSSDLKFYGYTGSTAETYANSHGITFVPIPLKVTGGTLGKDYTYDVAGGVLTVLTPTPLTIENVDKDTATSHRIVVAKDISANITLAGVNIENSSASPFEIEKDSKGNVTITLADGTTNTLKVTYSNNSAALQKEGDGENIGKLTIQGGTLGTGALIVEADGGAGIGSGDDGGSVSNISITGGIVTATSVNGGGIGCGYCSAHDGYSVSNISITGGIVTAKSVNGGGIGSGYAITLGGAVSGITISGGCVTASSKDGAGIGSGYAEAESGAVSDITISGGCVTASSTNGAGIGKGRGGPGTSNTTSNIKITGGSVKARRGDVESLGCTPTDGKGNNVYLLTLANPDGKTVTIDGTEFPYKQHSDSDTNLYIYLAGIDRIVTVGDDTTKKFFNSTSKTFEDAKVALLAKNGTLRGYYADLKTAFNDAQANDIVKMLCDITLSEALEINHKTVTLDLNGFELTAPGVAVIKISGDMAFHLKDSSVGKTGKIIAEDGGDAVGVHCSTAASFVMHGGTIQCSDCFSVDCYDTATFAIYGGTINGTIRLTSGANIMEAKGGTVQGKVVGIGNIDRNMTTESENDIESYTKFLGTVTGSIDDEAYPYTITLKIGSKTQTLPLLRGQSIDLAKFTELSLPTDDTLLGWYLTDASGTEKVADLAKFLDDGTSEKAPGAYTLKAKLVSEEIDDLEQAIKALETANTNLNNALSGKADQSALTSAISDVEGKITDLTTALSGKAAQIDLNTLTTTVNTLQAAVDALEAAQSNYATTAAMNTAITDAVNAAKSAQDTVINELKARLDTAESNIQNLTNNKANKTDLETAVTELKALIQALEAVKDNYVSADAALKTDLEGQITSAKTALTAAENRIAALESEVTDIKQQIADLEAAKQQLENDLATKANADDVSNSIDALKAEISKLNTALSGKADNDTLQDAVSALQSAVDTLNAAKDAYAAADTELEKKLSTAISEAETTLKGLIDEVQTKLDSAIADLNRAILNGDSNLGARITSLSVALNAAKSTLEKADSDNLAALNQAIANAEATLKGLIDSVQTDLSKAITDLNKAISDGDSDLNTKIADLTEALNAAKATLEATDAADRAALEGQITDAQTTLQNAIDKVAGDLADAKAALEARNAQLEAKNDDQDAEVARLQTFVTVVCVIACVSLAGNVAIVTGTFLLKRKRTHK